MRRLLPAVFLALMLLTISVSCDGASQDTEVETDRFRVGDSPVLKATVGNGKIEVLVGNPGEIDVEATLVGVESIIYEAFTDGGNVTVRAETERGARANLVIRAPVGTIVEAVTGNGTVDVTGIPGVRKVVSGNGRVTITGADSDLTVTTGNGAISVSESTGRFDLTTGNGAITLDASGEFDLLSGNGSIKYGGELAPGARNRAISGNGSIDLLLLGTPNVTLDLETERGEVSNQLGGTATFASEKEYRGVLGDGSASLQARSGNGSIVVR